MTSWIDLIILTPLQVAGPPVSARPSGAGSLHRLRRGSKSGDPMWLRQPVPGAVLANYGLDTLRFVKPVGIGDTIQARV